MNIGIDIDDTISNTYEVMFEYAQKYTIDTLKRKGDIYPVDATTHLYCKGLHNWNDEEEKEFFNQYYKNVLTNVKPKLFSTETINLLREEGNKIYIITARWEDSSFDVKQTTINWLKDNEIQYDELIINAEDKLGFAKSRNIEVFIDDSYKNCKPISEIGVRTFLMDSKVNTNIKDEKIQRIYSWPHFYQKLEEMKEEI